MSFPTCNDNTLDFIFTSHPSYRERCQSPPLISAKSDHPGVTMTSSCLILLTSQSEPGLSGELSTFGRKKADTTEL